MLSEFVRDQIDPDQAIQEATTERPGKPLRIRLQPQILRQSNGRTQYQTWKQVRWTLECDSPAEVFATRDAMRAFFEVLGTLGPAAVHRALDVIKAVNHANKGAA
jgi:hypothetical protein